MIPMTLMTNDANDYTMSKRPLFSIFLFFAFYLGTFAQLPGPDATFGLNGASWRNIYPTDDQAFALALRPDGRTVIAGRTTIDSVSQMAVFQFLPNGKPDMTFHWNSKAALQFNDKASAANALVPDADGRVILAGYATLEDRERFGLMRLLPDGTPDPSFGANGQVLTDFGTSIQRANALALQPDGKIVAAGFIRTGKDADFALARYLPDGTPDPSFGTNGLVTTKIDSLSDVIWDIALQSNGRIVVCGSTLSTSVFNFPSFFVVARYLPDGKLDPTFGGFGTVVTDLNADEESDIARSVTISSTGFIVVAGYSAENLASKISVVRYRPSGLLDSNFGASGIASLTAVPTYGNFCTDIKTLPGDQLLLTGMAENVDFKDIFLLKLLPNGSRDASFGQNGQIIRSFSSKDDNAAALALRPDGHILVAGDTRAEGDFYTDALLFQFNADGSKDATFGNDGAVVGDLGTSADVGTAVLVFPDGKILAGGSTNNEPYKNDWALLRFLPNGQPDPIFGSDGVRVVHPSGLDNLLNALIRLPDGKILGAGEAGTRALLARFQPDGSLDNTFGQLGQAFMATAGASPEYQSLVLLPDGLILAAGTRSDNTGQRAGIVVRYNANGTVDPSFGQSGSATVADAQWSKILLQPDGKFIVVGIRAVNSMTPTILMVMRYQADGTPDASFEFKYTITTSLYGFSAALQPDGKIVVVGQTNSAYMACRLQPDGSLDSSFGTNGFVLPVKGNTPQVLYDVLVQADKRIVLFGGDRLSSPDPAYKGFTTIRLQSNGSFDNTWGQGGYLPLRGLYARAAAFDSDGNMLAAGSIDNGERADIVVYRLLRGEYVGTVDRPAETAGGGILNVFPNPVRDELTLEYDLLDNQSVDIQLYDLNGRLLHTLLAHSQRPAGTHTERLQLPDGLSKGMYTVVIQTATGSVAVQIVK